MSALEPRTLLSAVPPLGSNPKANAHIYLDFGGQVVERWGDFAPGTTPAFDQDGDPARFSDAELTSIREIWERVAEKFSPFDLNVTTIEGGNVDRTVHAIIGGEGAWFGDVAGGAAYVGGFRNSDPGSVFVFSDRLGKGDALQVAESVAHEVGHAFGLLHQSLWSGHALIADYNPGDEASAPIMGKSYDAGRGLWWRGTSELGSSALQDDMAIIASAANGFGYRKDDQRDSHHPAATHLKGLEPGTSGVIETMGDADFFRFDTGAGTVRFSAETIAHGATLDLKLELRSSSGKVLATADSDALAETLAASVEAGTYFIGVMSEGQYGDVGQYALKGNVIAPPMPAPRPPSPRLATPTGVKTRATASGAARLRWKDWSIDETGFRVEYSTNKERWRRVGLTRANATTIEIHRLKPRTTYWFRLRAFNDQTESKWSKTARTTTPRSPLAAAKVPKRPPAIKRIFERSPAAPDVLNRLADASVWT